MSDTIVKTERFIGAFSEVKLLTVKAETGVYARYYAIIKDGKPVYSSPLIYGGSTDDVNRNVNSALQVVRELLTEMGFLTGEVVGS
jgi:hypothetical protein